MAYILKVAQSARGAAFLLFLGGAGLRIFEVAACEQNGAIEKRDNIKKNRVL